MLVALPRGHRHLATVGEATAPVQVLHRGAPRLALPGSPGACRDAWDEILRWQFDYRHQPCNFVEIMPRLDEHLRRPKAKGASV